MGQNNVDTSILTLLSRDFTPRGSISFHFLSPNNAANERIDFKVWNQDKY